MEKYVVNYLYILILFLVESWELVVFERIFVIEKNYGGMLGSLE